MGCFELLRGRSVALCLARCSEGLAVCVVKTDVECKLKACCGQECCGQSAVVEHCVARLLRGYWVIDMLFL